MANLIITIISIALAVIVATMTIFYVGQAFSSQSSKAMAIQLNNILLQLRGAANAYMADTGRDFVSVLPSATSNPTAAEISTVLVPQYLNSPLTYPTSLYIPTEGGCGGLFLASLNGQFNASAGGGVVLWYLPGGSQCHITQLAIDTCKELVRQNHGVNGEPPGSSNAGWIAGALPLFSEDHMDCYAQSTIANMNDCITPSGGQNNPCAIQFFGILYK